MENKVHKGKRAMKRKRGYPTAWKGAANRWGKVDGTAVPKPEQKFTRERVATRATSVASFPGSFHFSISQFHMCSWPNSSSPSSDVQVKVLSAHKLLFISKTVRRLRNFETKIMTSESLPREVNAQIITLLSKISALRENGDQELERRAPMSVESRSLELWRAVAVECFATFLFSLVVSGAAVSSAVSGSGLSVLSTAVASGFAIAAIAIIFGHVSGKKPNFLFL